ncbi:tol-pal system protein YbgF [Candidatus Deferrimicrobium sp.]|uniref:tol-pal system protein YbgF n=1 Tax=Candidatus Deferrimicrobium sp. TaxID=3060586 RepID=UPI00271E2F62|nr:tol-pal system protein YbgF [Candidatus Deferrimicrobium sp.]MDO8737998.1 tol-pal system protein YbgF [Candidatus Deferrimicrobium sp.]
MARNAVVFPLIGAFAAFMAGCAVMDTGAFARLQDEMVGLRKEMAVLRTAPPPAPVLAAERADAGEIQSLRKSFADMNSDFDRVRTDQLAATTRMDEARVEMQRITARQDAQERAPQEIQGNADRVKEIEKRLAALEERIGKLAAAPAAAPAPESPREWKSPEEMYEVAVGQVKGGNPKKGRETLSDFAAKYPDHKLIPNALYWKGEAFYAEKDFENAILTFQDVVDKYPRGEKAPDAMYKQGLSFLSLKDKKNARILLDLVPKKYPKSKAAEMAKKKLKEIR